MVLIIDVVSLCKIQTGRDQRCRGLRGSMHGVRRDLLFLDFQCFRMYLSDLRLAFPEGISHLRA